MKDLHTGAVVQLIFPKAWDSVLHDFLKPITPVSARGTTGEFFPTPLSQENQALGALESITGGHAAYCAFSAAAFQAPHVRQPRTWLFIGAEWEEECAAALGAKLVETGENLLVLIPDDLGVFYGQESTADNCLCTNPVQTYVDLWHC